jgi:hypothetical protein
MRLLVVSAFIFFISCKKGTSTFTIQGTVTDATFQKGLNGGTLSLYQVPVSTSNQELIGTVQLGQNGAYSFTFPRGKMDKYLVKITKDNYFNQEETILFSSLTVEKDNIRNYSTTAKSWVRLKFLNQDPADTDELVYTKQQGKTNCPACCPSSQQTLLGIVDTSIYCINDGNSVYSIYYSVLGTSNSGILSTATLPFDTTEIYLAY